MPVVAFQLPTSGTDEVSKMKSAPPSCKKKGIPKIVETAVIGGGGTPRVLKRPICVLDIAP